MALLVRAIRISKSTKYDRYLFIIENDRSKVLHGTYPNKLDFHCILSQYEIQEAAQQPAALRKGIQNQESGGL